MNDLQEIFARIKRQLDLNEKPIELFCCQCQLSSNNNNDIPVLYREGYKEPHCQQCFRKIDPFYNSKKAKDSPMEYIHVCGVDGIYKYCSFDNFEGEFSELEYLRNYATSSKLENLFVTGKTGVGKTHLTTAILYKLIERGIDYYKMFFINENDYNTKLLKAQKIAFSEIQYIKTIFTNYELLVFDELGMKESSQAKAINTLELIEKRIVNQKTTILVSNLSKLDLRDKYGDPFYSRLHLFKEIKINLPDYRKKPRMYKKLINPEPNQKE